MALSTFLAYVTDGKFGFKHPIPKPNAPLLALVIPSHETLLASVTFRLNAAEKEYKQLLAREPQSNNTANALRRFISFRILWENRIEHQLRAKPDTDLEQRIKQHKEETKGLIRSNEKLFFGEAADELAVNTLPEQYLPEGTKSTEKMRAEKEYAELEMLIYAYEPRGTNPKTGLPWTHQDLVDLWDRTERLSKESPEYAALPDCLNTWDIRGDIATAKIISKIIAWKITEGKRPSDQELGALWLRYSRGKISYDSFRALKAIGRSELKELKEAMLEAAEKTGIAAQQEPIAARMYEETTAAPLEKEEPPSSTVPAIPTPDQALQDSVYTRIDEFEKEWNTQAAEGKWTHEAMVKLYRDVVSLEKQEPGKWMDLLQKLEFGSILSLADTAQRYIDWKKSCGPEPSREDQQELSSMAVGWHLPEPIQKALEDGLTKTQFYKLTINGNGDSTSTDSQDTALERLLAQGMAQKASEEHKNGYHEIELPPLADGTKRKLRMLTPCLRNFLDLTQSGFELYAAGKLVDRLLRNEPVGQRNNKLMTDFVRPVYQLRTGNMRVLYVVKDNVITLVYAYDKNSQKMPPRVREALNTRLGSL